MREFTVQSGSASLACEEHGRGPTVVALHPGVGDRRAWREMAAALDGVRLVTYDRRGFGTTAYEAEEFAHVDDLKAVIDAVAGSDPVVLVGNSMGGLHSLEFALAYPERVRAMLLLAPAVSGAPWGLAEFAASATALEEQIEAAIEAGDLDEANRLEAWMWLDGSDEPEGRMTGAARDLFLDMNGIALRAPETGAEREQPDVWPRAEELAMPVVFATGDLDAGMPAAYYETLAERAPQGRFLLLPGVAHIPQMEQPEAIAALVREIARQE